MVFSKFDLELQTEAGMEKDGNFKWGHFFDIATCNKELGRDKIQV